MDSHGIANGFTRYKDESGNLMTVGDCMLRQLVIRKSAPLVVWRVIEMLQPVHSLLSAMAMRAREYEAGHGIATMVIPHYEDFFYFLLAEREAVSRRKNWLAMFGGN